MNKPTDNSIDDLFFCNSHAGRGQTDCLNCVLRDKKPLIKAQLRDLLLSKAVSNPTTPAGEPEFVPVSEINNLFEEDE